MFWKKIKAQHRAKYGSSFCNDNSEEAKEKNHREFEVAVWVPATLDYRERLCLKNQNIKTKGSHMCICSDFNENDVHLPIYFICDR